MEGSSPLVYSWSKGGVPITGETNLSLTLTNLAFSDVGSYVLNLTNNFGSSNSQPATLAVAAQPTFAFLTNGLVLHLKFDGSYTDSSGRGNHGTNAGTALVPGRIGSGALSYSTATNPFSATYVDLGVRPDLQFGTNTDFSIAFWIRFTNAPNDLPFFCNSDESLGSAGYTIAPSYGTGGIGWSLNSYRFEGGDNLLNNGDWHHVVISAARTGDVVTYVDGLAIDKRFATTENLDTGFNTVIGQNCFFTYAEAGDFEMDDLGVWRRALTPIEAYTAWYVGQNYNRSYDTYRPVVLQLRQNGTALELIWQAGTLQEATSAAGPWTNVPGAASPYYPTTIGAGTKLYRVKL